MDTRIAALHAAVAAVVANHAARGDLSAAEVAQYLEEAAKGMRLNAAFALRGEDLAAAIRPESVT